MVYGMKCVGYLKEFQEELVQKFATWVSPPRAGKKAKADKKTKIKSEDVKSAKTTSESSEKHAARNVRKSKISARSDSEESDSEDVEDESDEEAMDIDNLMSSRWVYTPRGTRSRPLTSRR